MPNNNKGATISKSKKNSPTKHSLTSTAVLAALQRQEGNARIIHRSANLLFLIQIEVLVLGTVKI